MDEYRSGLLSSIPDLRRFARTMVGNPSLADDIVQDCLERALSRRHLYAPGSNLRAWLFTILHNCFRNHLRHRANHPHEGEEAMQRLQSPDGGPLERLAVRDLQAVVQCLPLAQREVLLLVALEGMSYQEAADAAGTTLKHVRSRIKGARRALRKLA